jgi:hypothetical protein
MIMVLGLEEYFEELGGIGDVQGGLLRKPHEVAISADDRLGTVM